MDIEVRTVQGTSAMEELKSQGFEVIGSYEDNSVTYYMMKRNIDSYE